MTFGGRRVGVRRPRVRATDGSGELAVPSYDVFASTELLDGLALEKMMAKLSTRRYRAGLEPVGTAVANSWNNDDLLAEACRQRFSATDRLIVDWTQLGLLDAPTIRSAGRGSLKGVRSDS